MNPAAVHIADVAHQFGFSNTIDPATHQMRWRITCEGCGATDDHNLPPTCSPVIMVRNARRRGWIAGKKTAAICPKCQRERIANTLKAKGAHLSIVPAIDAPQPEIPTVIEPLKPEALQALKAKFSKKGPVEVAAPAKGALVEVHYEPRVKPTLHLNRPSQAYFAAPIKDIEPEVIEPAPAMREPHAYEYSEPAAPQGKLTNELFELEPKRARKLYRVLDEFFRDDTHRYEQGWSDAKVADFVGVSVELVAAVREKAYGRADVDPVVKDLKDDLTILKMQMDEDIAKLNIEIGRIVEQAAKDIADVEARIAALEKA